MCKEAIFKLLVLTNLYPKESVENTLFMTNVSCPSLVYLKSGTSTENSVEEVSAGHHRLPQVLTRSGERRRTYRAHRTPNWDGRTERQSQVGLGTSSPVSLTVPSSVNGSLYVGVFMTRTKQVETPVRKTQGSESLLRSISPLRPISLC